MDSKEILEKIMKEKGISKEELDKKIEEKKKEMPNISDQGIAIMISKELGVETQKTKSREVVIKDIVPNMSGIDFKAKVLNKSPEREFSTDKGKGRVQNLLLSDETGKVRLTLWNDEIDKFKDINEGDSIKLQNCRSRADNFQNPQIGLGYGGEFEKLDEDVPAVKPKESLADIESNDDVEVNAMLLEVFERPLVYYFCPQCNQKAVNGECPEHGSVEAQKRLILAGVLDDGNRSINAVFFGDQAENLMQKTTDQVEDELKNKTTTEFIDSLSIITKEFNVFGNIRENKMNGELELRVKNVSLKV